LYRKVSGRILRAVRRWWLVLAMQGLPPFR